ncbi:MAG TPA: hypothetical protein VHQ90_10850 [Thermoanaerobaculia bacterium]|nr:hypothetical protein [Thermoanaerobaculia bacterium]
MNRCRAVVLASLAFQICSAAVAQTNGFIYTRPTCVPPTNGTQCPVIYLQGPDPILLDNGDIAILLDGGQAGNGCWEGLFSLVYPASGHVATARFNPIWASNNWGNHPERHEAEAPFPSAAFINGQWRLVYTSTFQPYSTDRDRVARIDMPNLTDRAHASQVTNQWILPVNPACQPLGACAGGGSGILGTLALHPDGSIYVYHPDGNNPGCASGWIRHRVNSDMSLPNPAGDGCLVFNSVSPFTSFLSDIALGADGNLYLLNSRRGGDLGTIEEWISTPASPGGLGLGWTLSGRVWYAPANPNPGYIYSVWDAGYLKDKNRRIIEPRVVVANISDGRTFDEINNYGLGRWFLYYWADAGATLPSGFGGSAGSCPFVGNHDSTSCTAITGWAADPGALNTPMSVDISDGNQLQTTVPANIYRADLQAASYGNGVHGFSLQVPGGVKDGSTHTITAYYSGTSTPLPNSPQTLTCAPDPGALSFYTVTPCRILDTRTTGQPFTSSAPRTLQITGACGIPATAKAVVFNMTAVGATGRVSFQFYPGDLSATTATGVSAGPNHPTIAAMAVLGLATNGTGTLGAVVAFDAGGQVDLVVDTAGYFN